MAAQSLIPVLSSATASPVRSISEKRLCSLWAGYGSVSQLIATCKDGKKETFIIKQVRPPAGAGVSHNRKVQSYKVEAYFYNHLAADVLKAGGNIPHPLQVLAEGDSFTFVLSDLQRDFPLERSSYSFQQAKVVVEWLARFHAVFWETSPPSGVWEQGCYWHLQTRLEELEEMGSEWKELKSLAPLLDAAIRGAEGTFKNRTLVHGDMKSANLLFNSAGTECAAYDFQYCGAGPGVRDLAYLFASSVDQSVVRKHEEQLLDHYHQTLCKHVSEIHQRDAAYTKEQLILDYELCLADYLRFLAGWGWWGNVSWLKGKVRDALPRLKEHLKQFQPSC